MNTPVGASDLQQLLATLHPARRPRELVPERSKVIRLGPEAQALGEAIAAPLTPPPLVAPGMTPAAPRRAGGITNLAALGARRVDTLGAAGGDEVGATPPPAGPLPPVQSWRASPRGPVPLTRADRVTPPGGTRPAAAPPPASARLHSAASAAAVPVVAASWGSGAVAAAVAVERHPATAERLPTIAAPAPRMRRETARVVVRGGGAWRALVVAAAAALLLVAGGVHFLVVPLEVLVVWRKPATLTVTSEPLGAVVKLDGATVGVTPVEASVRRDRFDHILQLSAPGYRDLRQTVRYDMSVALSARARLERESTPTFEEMPAPAPAPSAGREVEPSPMPKGAVAKATKVKGGARAKAGGKTAARARAVAKHRS